MKKYIFFILMIACFACKHKGSSSLELNLTFGNPDAVGELKEFYLTSLTTINKTISFKNVTSVTPNKFVFEHVDTDLYIGMMRIEKNGMTYNISIDSIRIHDGVNVISKEVNLGAVQLYGMVVFTCWEKDEALNIQLEPWALPYKLNPGSEIKFIATQPTNKFHWALRIDHADKSVQLFPESTDNFGAIEVYINDEIIDTVY